MTVIKPLKALFCFIDTEYYRVKESVLKGLEMALKRVVATWYIIDIQNYTVNK